MKFVLGLWAAFLAGAAHAQSVTLNISFSEKAAAIMAEKGELLMVSGYFMGEPAANATIPADEMGMIFLGTEDLTLWPSAQSVTLGGLLAGAPLDQVVEPRLNVNLYSARISSEDNILNCDLVDDTVAVLATKPQDILCKLIDE